LLKKELLEQGKEWFVSVIKEGLALLPASSMLKE